MSIDIGIVVVSDATPSGTVASDPTQADWLWFQPNTNTWHKQVEGEWEAVVPDGVTGEFEGTPKKITLVNGIVTDFELDE